MLSASSAPVIRATLPVVGAHLNEITDRFYKRLFEAHPELLRNLFNRGNQANGEQRQALAGSIAAFAQGLVDPDGPGVSGARDLMITRIAHKHASLGVIADQYPIVHKHLFAAIVEVLGDAVTPEVAAAWDEVYWLMAETLIAAEKGLYEEAEAPEGSVWREMEIVERLQETPDTVSFTLRRVDGRPAGTFRPGQYISVQVPLADGARQIRQYSLSSTPDQADWRITVKHREDEPVPGEVSGRLHREARPGDVLTVSAPFGDMVLPEGDGPLLLASAGVGCTPMMAMLGRLVDEDSKREIIVVHADRGPDQHAHREEQRRLVEQLPQAQLHLWYEQPDARTPEASVGRVDLDALALPKDVTVCLCGPLPFLRALRGDLLRRGVPATAIHYEVFGPDLWIARG
ncbi:globin domain-containing protein [Streptomyces palmae]|uniref:nitric oxide dioxygenase n=1 Tax=Streptomyces palmae TaxID=1701085 RepID=A0A4Z0H9T7_9ACTN|nr:globin domain-containing protein [Streptomyces palmae]TGB12039.1 hemin transporter [Streptomyces palmae]